MKLASWNINGMRSVVGKGALQSFLKEHAPDILCLQETKAERGQAVVELPEYEEYWNSSVRKKGYAGTAIFVKKSEAKEVKGVQMGIPEAIAKKYNLTDRFGDANAECRVMALEFGQWYVVNVYTPNAKPDLARLEFRHKHWDPAFLAYMQQLQKKKPVIFCGDLNVAHTPEDLANPKANEGEHGFTVEERQGVDKIIAAGFVDTFRLFHTGKGHYTWWSHFQNARARNVGWRIDYWFVSKKLAPKVKSVEILPNSMGSDHCPVILELK